ncbi:L,D-transpeptidase family protein [Novisyntrophococcus fermenticellae]|uniref:L,D-transpeptidase family protein n=1 Tax=Novisyntrophococcus fermenticellae TaxID=2068655 RepID=UPI001E586EDD|nr:L,D-transpeptidase family protein [Novisyntrophococcus fermenticellae]
MGYDDNNFQEQLEKELENFMGQPVPEYQEKQEDREDDYRYDAYGGDGSNNRKSGKVKIIVLSVLAVLFVTLAGVYGGYTYYYNSRFLKGTMINNTDCSGLTVNQAEANIRDQVEKYGLELEFQDGQKSEIRGTDVNLAYVPDGSIEKLKEEQNPFLWFKGVFGGSENYEFKAGIKYDEEKLNQIVTAMPQMQAANMEEPSDAKVEFVDTRFQVTPEVNGSKLDMDKVMKGIQETMESGEKKLSLEKLGAYIRPGVTADDKTLKAQADRLNELTASSITYQLPAGDQVLDGSTLKDWLTVDENGSYSKDETAWNQHIAEYVAAMAQAVNTYDTDAKFNATGLGEITVKGKYGFQINQEAEVAQLTEELANHTVTTRKPNFSHEALYYENNGFGNSYVEIDLSRQYVWVYKDGALAVETGCVSGMMTSDRWTPPGIFTLTFKKSPSVLRGPKKEDGTYEWESPVTYWMPFNGGIGLHDATWRSSSQFGTNTYKRSGSHGCINLPKSKAQAIYEIIDKSMPIICYYSEPYSVGASTKKSISSSANKTPTQAPTEAPTKTPTKTPTENPQTPTPDPTEAPTPEQTPTDPPPTDTPAPETPNE